ncbi:MoaD/ThiS family protein [Fundidesulfovibrio agrisoli]|uniref:MoaD/ThiS family protein n=1 Tax=Fundidesulfovibrio agrisoli TaxID=2922717 RepID=UPI001FAC284E|nr:MoaD/ThiS family protein [Fundidesulfovibrio agrisoli]
MKVTVELVGHLGRNRPAGHAPARSETLPEGATLGELLALLGFADAGELIAIQDGAPASPGTPLRDGAEIRLIPMVDGG